MEYEFREVFSSSKDEREEAKAEAVIYDWDRPYDEKAKEPLAKGEELIVPVLYISES